MVNIESLKERTLVILKPDAMLRGVSGEIISRFEKSGLKLVGAKLTHATEEMAAEHYIEDENWLETVGMKAKKGYEKMGKSIDIPNREIGLRVRSALIDYLTMSPVLCLVYEGHNAVKHVRKLVGETSPEASAPGTIRGDYAFDTYPLADASNRPVQNLIHASGEVDEARREITVWFSDNELHSWQRIDEALLYRVVDN